MKGKSTHETEGKCYMRFFRGFPETNTVFMNLYHFFEVINCFGLNREELN